ncbi:MAG: YraN family protein [Candidatus Sedimenticola sp. PURPLELP]
MTGPGSHRESGPAAEHQARRYLEARGLTTRETNYRGRRGEIDLIMNEGDTLVFVEVRYRSNITFGSPAESVNLSKQQKLITTASQYLQQQFRSNPPACRFDVLAISGKEQENVDWIRDAFQPSL